MADLYSREDDDSNVFNEYEKVCSKMENISGKIKKLRKKKKGKKKKELKAHIKKLEKKLNKLNEKYTWWQEVILVSAPKAIDAFAAIKVAKIKYAKSNALPKKKSVRRFYQ